MEADSDLPAIAQDGSTFQKVESLQQTDQRSRSSHEAESPSQVHHDAPAVRILLLAFMFMFQGYGVMNGNPQHILKEKMHISGPSSSAAFQNATASFQLSKLLMRILQIAFLVFLSPNGIVYVAYVIMLCAVLVPIVFLWCLEINDLWVVYLQYLLGGVAVGLFEGTFLSVISTLGRNTKTFVIMGTPLGFAVHNVILGTFQQWGMPSVCYYIFTACCLPFAILIFYLYAPVHDSTSRAQGRGCDAFMNSMRKSSEWLPPMLPWMLAKFFGNFVLEDCFPLLYNTFNTAWVPMLGGPSSTTHTIPFAYYTAWYYFVLMAMGDTISRRVPYYISLDSWKSCAVCISVSVALCVGGEALNFLLIAIVTGIATFISNFGNGFIYGLSAKFIDAYIPVEHHYAAYNLWCFCGDIGGYAGQGALSVKIAQAACRGKHYTYVCAKKSETSLQSERHGDTSVSPLTASFAVAVHHTGESIVV